MGTPVEADIVRNNYSKLMYNANGRLHTFTCMKVTITLS